MQENKYITLNLAAPMYVLMLLFPYLIGSVFLPFLVIDVFTHPFKWSKFYAVFIATALAFLFLSFNLVHPYFIRFSQRTKYLLWTLLIFLIFNYFFHGVSPFYIETYQRIVFWSLTFFFLGLVMMISEEDRTLIFLPLFFGLTLFILIDLTVFIIFKEHPPYLTFGNPNMSAEYAGLCFGLMLGGYNQLKKYGYATFLDFLIPLTATYIFYTNCRSSYIGIALVSAYMLFMRVISFQHFMKLVRFFLVFSIGIFLFFISFDESGITSNFVGTAIHKEHSTLKRWDILKDSLYMLFENPLGMGLGSYEFASVPYLTNLFPHFNEHFLFKSPHTEFLRFMIEDGLIVVGLMITCFFSFMYDVRKILPNILSTHPEIVGFFLFLSIHFALQFPLDNPFPFFMTALMTAYFLANFKNALYPLELPSVRKYSIILFLVIFIGSITKIFSGYVDRTYPRNRDLNDWACRLDPSNWSACLNVVVYDLSHRNFEKAQIGALQELSKRENNFHALRYLSFIYLVKGETQKACPLMQKYDRFFAEKSSLHELWLKKCSLNK